MREESLCQSSLWMLSGQGMSVAAQAFYFVLIARALGSREYGSFAGVVALVAALSQCSSLGMEMILVRNVSRDRSSFAITWGQSLAILAAGSFLLFVIAVVVAHLLLAPDLRGIVPWVVLSDGLFGRFIQLASRAFQGAGLLAWTARLTALANIGRAITAAAVYALARAAHSQPTAQLWAQVYWLSTMAVALTAAVVTTHILGRPRLARIRSTDLNQGLSFAFSGSSISLYNDIDKTFLISLGQIGAAGIYSAAYRAIDVATMPLYSFYAAATPHFFRLGTSGPAETAAFGRRAIIRSLPFAALASAIIFVAAPMLPVAFGASFRESIPALRWLCLLPVLRALHYGWGTAITASASQWNRTATQLGAAALNLLLDVVLIPRWSWRGAAAASLATDAALALFSYLVLASLLRQDQRRDHREKRALRSEFTQ